MIRRSSLLFLIILAAGCGASDKLVVGSKPFTESEIMGEIIAQLAESVGGKVDRKFYVGGIVCFESTKNGTMDAYVDYTGTGLVTILGEPASTDQDAVFAKVRKEFAARWGIEWMPRLGFNNTYALAIRKKDVKKLGLKTISDLKGKKLRCGFDPVFLDRPDGYPGLIKRYGFEFCSEKRQMDPGLMYTAVAEGEVDVISSYSTDGRIKTKDLFLLTDDANFFPPYDAAPLLGPNALKKLPALGPKLKSLAGRIDDATMTRLNAAVDQEKRPTAEVVREFLKAEGLL